MEKTRAKQMGLLVQATRQIHMKWAEHVKECKTVEERKLVPEGIGRVSLAVEGIIKDTEYEKTYKPIKEMLFDERVAIRAIGENLLSEFVYGKRHLDFCNVNHLATYWWQDEGVDAHLSVDPVWVAFSGENGLREINKDDIDLCHRFGMDMLRCFLENGFEFAAMNKLLWRMVPEPVCECGKCLQLFLQDLDAALQIAKERCMPIFWNLAYELTCGRKGIPIIPQLFDLTVRNAGEALELMRDSIRDRKDPIAWMIENTTCTFVGANDLASLAGFLYYDAQNGRCDKKLKGVAIDVIQELGREPILRNKMMRKMGIPKIL